MCTEGLTLAAENLVHGKHDEKTDRREKMTSDELAHEEMVNGNVVQDKIIQEEVINNKVKITLMDEEEEEMLNEVVRRSAMWDANQKSRV